MIRAQIVLSLAAAIASSLPGRAGAQVASGMYDAVGNYDGANTAPWGMWDHAEAVVLSGRISDRIRGVTAPAPAQGPAAARFFVDGATDQNRAVNLGCATPTSCPVDGGNSPVERAEVVRSDTGLQQAGTEYWYRWWTRVNGPGAVDPFPYVLNGPNGHFNILAQWKSTPPFDGSGPPLAVTIQPPAANPLQPETLIRDESPTDPAVVYVDIGANPSPNPVVRTHRIYLGRVIRDRFVEIVVHVRWSFGSDGFVEAWYDGKKGIDPENPTATRIAGRTLADTSSVYLKQGLYRAHAPNAATVLHDGMAIWSACPSATCQGTGPVTPPPNGGTPNPAPASVILDVLNVVLD